MKSLEVTLNLIAKADGVASVFMNVFIARHCQRQTMARFALWRDQELLKSLVYASAFPYGALRVGKVLSLMRHNIYF